MRKTYPVMFQGESDKSLINQATTFAYPFTRVYSPPLFLALDITDSDAAFGGKKGDEYDKVGY